MKQALQGHMGLCFSCVVGRVLHCESAMREDDCSVNVEITVMPPAIQYSRDLG